MDNRLAKSDTSNAEPQLATHSNAVNLSQTSAPYLSQTDQAIPALSTPGVPKIVPTAIMSGLGSAPSLVDKNIVPANASGAGSMYPYRSAHDIGGPLKELHGRTFNNLNDVYLLPSDEVEWERLNKQHSALAIGMSGPFPCPLELVDEVLSPSAGESPKRILDVGCGTGTWTIEVAQKYPHCQVLGIDVSPIPLDATIVPPNLAFELYDINQGLQRYHNPPHFDFINMRCVMGGIKDMNKILRDLEMCLRPGGLLIVIDGDLPYEETRQECVKMVKMEGDEDISSVSPNGSWMRRILCEANESARSTGLGVDTSPWVLDVGPWDHDLCDPDSTVTGGVYIPLGPWAQGKNQTESQMLRLSGILLREAFLNIIHAFHSIILRHGVDQATLDEWTRNAEEELNKCTPPMWIRYRFFWTRRKSDDGSPLPRSKPTRPETVNQCPAIEYYSKEEAIAGAEKKRASRNEVPKSAAQRGWKSARAREATDSTSVPQ